MDNKLKIVFTSVLLLLVALSCDERKYLPTPPTEPPKPPGYQEDIPWPSLADSPWPMNHHDPQSTGRSKFVGPQNGIVDWIIDSVTIRSSVSIGPDSSIYLLSQSAENFGLFSFNNIGELNWNISGNNIFFSWDVSTPLVASDGTIYFTGGLGGKLYAINPDGTVKWEYLANYFLFQTGIVIGLDNTLYFLDSNKELYAVNNNGVLLWSFINEDFFSDVTSVLSFSPDGKHLYIPGKSKSLYSFNIDNTAIEWSFGNTTLYSAPMIDSDGHIYIQSKSDNYNEGKYSFFCLNPDGTVRWSYAHNNQQMNVVSGYGDATIDKLGNIYFAFDTLYALNYNGFLRWKLNLEGYTYTPLINDANGIIYVSILETPYTIKEVAAIDSSGRKLWFLPISDKYPGDVGGLSPVIDNTGKLYLPTYKQQSFFVIK